MKISKTSKKFTKTISTLILAVLMVTSAFLVLSTTELTTVKAQTSDPNDYGDVMQYEWPRPGYDSAGTMFSPGPGPESPGILWRIKDMGMLSSYYPVAFNGMVFVSNYTITAALEPFTGDIIWTVPNTGNVFKIDDTHMVIGSNCYDIETGNLIWEHPASGYSPEALSTSFIHLSGYIPEEKLFLCSTYWYPTQAWKLDDPDQPPTLAWSRPDLESEGGIGTQFGGAPYGEGMLFGLGLGHIMAINASTGETIWKVDMPLGLPYYGGGYYMGIYWQPDLSGNMFGFNATNGELLWTFNPQTSWNYWNSRGAAAYGNIYYYNADRNVYAIDVLTGEVKWTYEGPGHFYAGGPIVADGKVYMNTGSQSYMDPDTGENNGREFACLNATTGELIWKIPISLTEQYASNLMIAYGNLYLIVASYPGHPSTQLAVNGDEFWCISGEPKDWPMYGGDAAHTATNAGPYNLALKFTFQTGGSIVSSPTLVDGVGYVGSLDGKIYAFDADTGNQVWDFTTGHKVYSSPAVVGGRLYTGADDGNVYCIDATTGTKIWETPAGGIVDTSVSTTPKIRSSPTVVGNRVYVGSLDGNLYCFDASDGSIVWKFVAGGDIRCTPAVVDNAVYFSANTAGTGTLYKLDTSGGSVIWNTSIPYGRYRGMIQASPCVAEGMVFTANAAGNYYGLNASTGEIIWDYTKEDSSFGFIAILGSPLYADGKVYCASPDNFFFDCLDATTGEVIWQTFLIREIYAPPSYAVGRIYVGTENGVWYVLDAQTGEKISFYAGVYRHNWAGMSLYESRVYTGSFDGNVYCFEEAPPAEPYIPPSQEDIIAEKVLSMLPTAEEIADDAANRTINMLPPYPDVPTQEEVAADAAQRVIAMLPPYPDVPTQEQIADDAARRTIAMLPAYPEMPDMSTYLIINLVLIVLVAISIIIGLYSIIKKRK